MKTIWRGLLVMAVRWSLRQHAQAATRFPGTGGGQAAVLGFVGGHGRGDLDDVVLGLGFCRVVRWHC